ncbi:unnamed protein product [Fructobacillus cardui]|uniref:Uncharacterized protein n=1 Tax=Fructobacillus cardui TaxID=2893170 RepID=A0ABN9YN87_9LACO|nr:unnamed protein product [Fructobacillus cardui]
MTTGNWVADGLEQHLAEEAKWEREQERDEVADDEA